MLHVRKYTKNLTSTFKNSLPELQIKILKVIMTEFEELRMVHRLVAVVHR